MASQLQAGVARATITPPVGIAHAGWGAQLHERAQGVDLDLWATALALSDGHETAVMVDIDLIYLWDGMAETVRQAVADLTGLPPSHIRLSYTHTHSGPAFEGTWMKAGAELIPAYRDSLGGLIAGAAWEALNRLQPAHVAAGSGTSAIAVNRRFVTPEGNVVVGRNWEGHVDHEVKVLRIDDEREQPLAVVINYACHPITMGPFNELITPDYPGVAKRMVEQATGATCLFLQGAAGNVGPIRGCTTGDRSTYHRLGQLLGLEAARVALSLETLPRRERYVRTLESGAPLAVYADEPVEEPDARLQVATREVRLPLKEFGDVGALEAEAERCREALAALRGSGNEEEIRWATMLAKRAAMRADLAHQHAGQTHLTWELQAMRVGDVALLAMPGEPFVEIGQAVKARSPFTHTFFSGYSNVGWAYMPMPDAYPLGGYEVEITPFGPQAPGQVVEQSLALLRELAG